MFEWLGQDPTQKKSKFYGKLDDDLEEKIKKLESIKKEAQIQTSKLIALTRKVSKTQLDKALERQPESVSDLKVETSPTKGSPEEIL